MASYGIDDAYSSNPESSEVYVHERNSSSREGMQEVESTMEVLTSVTNVYKVVQARKGSMLLALAMLYPFLVLVGGVLVWDYLSPSDLMANYPHLVVLGTGLAFGFLVGRMILSHLCDEPKGLKTNMCMSLLYLPFAIANALAARLNDGVALVDEFWVLLGYCVFTMVLYLHFATSVIHEITTALGICCFRITRKKA
ncbi:choline/ethanolaminephosphotransferase [Salix suchowensis]|nr:choline/ethanolaminephosphotransferase [Salix suchowensis]